LDEAAWQITAFRQPYCMVVKKEAVTAITGLSDKQTKKRLSGQKNGKTNKCPLISKINENDLWILRDTVLG
jgi:hypothetical protein